MDLAVQLIEERAAKTGKGVKKAATAKKKSAPKKKTPAKK
jgi:topoisomerase IA-like protein